MSKQELNHLETMMTHIEYIQRDIQEIKDQLREKYSTDVFDKRYITRNEFLIYKGTVVTVIMLVLERLIDRFIL